MNDWYERKFLSSYEQKHLKTLGFKDDQIDQIDILVSLHEFKMHEQCSQKIIGVAAITTGIISIAILLVLILSKQLC